jgi:hypothetical protein
MANLKPILAGLCASALTYLCFLTWVHSTAASSAPEACRTPLSQLPNHFCGKPHSG